MIPTMLDEAAKEGGWVSSHLQKTRLTWISFGRGEVAVYAWRDRFRHTTGRAYRGNRLAGVFRTQREIADYLTDTRE